MNKEILAFLFSLAFCFSGIWVVIRKPTPEIQPQPTVCKSYVQIGVVEDAAPPDYYFGHGHRPCKGTQTGYCLGQCDGEHLTTGSQNIAIGYRASTK